MVGANGPGTNKGEGGNQQQRPDKQLAVLHFIGGPGDHDHRDGRRQIGNG